uniref:Uncharacterized protein n=1 Tax=viral metagenome TaxID=1070528 RepID=A0A6C0JES9_9ZZZZ
MFQFALGFACGIYIGHTYNLKPVIKKINEIIDENKKK